MIKIQASLKHSSISSKLVLLITTTTLFTLLGIMGWQLVTNGISTSIESLKTLQLFQSLGMFVIPPFVMAYFWSKNPITLLHLNRHSPLQNYLMVIIIMVVFIPFINLLTDFNHQIVFPASLGWLENQLKMAELQSNQLTEQFLSGSGINTLMFNILLIAILPALGEELFFRGSIFDIIHQWKNAIFAIWLTAAFFSAIHFQFYGFFPRMLLGAFFGYLLLWSGNMWLPILAHFTNNAMAVTFFYLKNNGYQVNNIDTVGTGSTWWIGCISGALCIWGVYIIRKKLLSENCQLTIEKQLL